MAPLQAATRRLNSCPFEIDASVVAVLADGGYLRVRANAAVDDEAAEIGDFD